MKRIGYFLLGLGWLLGSACRGPEPADLVLRGGKVATVDRSFSIEEAVAVRDGRIVFVGADGKIDAYVGPETRVLDMTGRLILPGLVDAHGHLIDLGHELIDLDINGTRSWEEVIERVAERVADTPPGEWLVGGRWDHNAWPGRRFPEHDALSAVSPENPVYLKRVDGNSAFANARALEIAGIDRDTPDPYGGVIMRQPDGEPTGVLVNRAMDLVLKHIPPDSPKITRDKLLQAAEYCLDLGLTGVHEAGAKPEHIRIYRELIDGGRLPIRVNAMFDEYALPKDTSGLAAFLQARRIENYGDHYLTVRSVKLYLDGALGSRGAAFFEPYADDPGNTGLFRIEPAFITRVSRAALEADMAVCTHCIGARGNRACLDAYAEALADFPGKDHRFRIEHAQIVRHEDVDRFAELGVIPSMQPVHCTSDMGFVADRVGEARAAGAYAWRWFREAGLTIPSGSDFPVESPNPLAGIHAAVTRQDGSGRPEGGWHPEQRLTIEEAIRGFTIWAAHAAFQEEVLGSIEIGKLADFTILDTDILTAPPPEILKAKPVMVIVAGRIRLER